MDYWRRLVDRLLKGFNNKESKMPKVGKKKFAYTAKGKVAAKKFAKKTGKKIKKVKAY